MGKDKKFKIGDIVVIKPSKKDNYIDWFAAATMKILNISSSGSYIDVIIVSNIDNIRVGFGTTETAANFKLKEVKIIEDD